MRELRFWNVVILYTLCCRFDNILLCFRAEKRQKICLYEKIVVPLQPETKMQAPWKREIQWPQDSMQSWRVPYLSSRVRLYHVALRIVTPKATSRRVNYLRTIHYHAVGIRMMLWHAFRPVWTKDYIAIQYLNCMMQRNQYCTRRCIARILYYSETMTRLYER